MDAIPTTQDQSKTPFEAVEAVRAKGLRFEMDEDDLRAKWCVRLWTNKNTHFLVENESLPTALTDAMIAALSQEGDYEDREDDMSPSNLQEDYRP
jgi:hypothetical protein